MRPQVCFFENVEGHVSLGLSTVISDLEELGYTVSWGLFSAEECGAPHQRKRVFILAADSNSYGVEGCWRSWVTIKDRQRRKSSETTCNYEFASVDWEGESKHALIGANDGGSDWVDRVRLLGNGVVPATATNAFVTLMYNVYKKVDWSKKLKTKAIRNRKRN